MGREAELAQVARCRAEAARGEPWVMTVEGEAGIGKTALVRHALAGGGDGLGVCWASCDPAEQDLPYGVVDQLLRRLPVDTAGAKDLVRSLTPAASPLAVGGGLLEVLAAATDTGPLALVIDDVPWADEQSTSVLGFMQRRLYCEPLLLVLTARTNTAGPAGGAAEGEVGGRGWQERVLRGAVRVEQVQLTGLTGAETRQLAAGHGAARLGPAAVARLQEATAGHPLHLHSLLAQVTPAQLADLSHPLPVPASLDAVIRHTLNRLPADARGLVEALAVLDRPAPLATITALAGMDDASTALGPALECGLVQWRPDDPTTPLRLHHALQRDAIYRALPPGQRQTLHARAAGLVSVDEAWAHRVAATTSTDPQLSGELAAEAEHLADGGRLGRAATLLLWAAGLALTRDQHEHQLLTAATHLLQLGQATARLAPLQGRLQACAPSPRRDTVLGFLAAQRGDLRTAQDLLTCALTTAPDADTTVLAAMSLATVHLYRCDGPQVVRLLRPLLDQLPPDTPTARLIRGLLALGAIFSDGPAAALAVIDEACLPDRAPQVTALDSQLLLYRGSCHVLAGRLQAGNEDLTTYPVRQHTDADLRITPVDHYMLAWARYLGGRWQDALIGADQAVVVADTTAQPEGLVFAHVIAAMVHAQRGDHGRARAHLTEARRSVPLFPEFNAILPVLGEAVLEQARGNRAGMARALAPLDPASPGMTRAMVLVWAPLLVDAHTSTDPARPATLQDLERAQQAMDTFDQLTNPDPGTTVPALACTSHWLHARLARAHRDTAMARTHYQRALDTPALEGDDIPLHRAFAHRDLAHLLMATGQAGDRRDAATHLHHAHQLFTRLGATPHTEHTTADLTNLGTTPPAVPGQDRAQGLTEREHAVAHLAAEGHTNQEIAQELYVSPKTVEYHLGHVYTKLQLTSRRQLRTALQSAPA
ncbi:LuxR family transcriptional regulator [Streptacidiphilus rugosus]|uniref:LuxR family transcriptional regulator n=1 Tax=Streptacidiphilus rugosus TaxID=405783 RepID=UPI00055C4410|nr:LuxR family transcriptional regulator [Streptacidiphilus rugosus]